MTAATTGPEAGPAEVSGLASALAYAAQMIRAFTRATAIAETVVAVLGDHGVTGPAITAVNLAQQLTAQASAAWTETLEALDRQSAVTEAYLAAPDAGDKEFLTAVGPGTTMETGREAPNVRDPGRHDVPAHVPGRGAGAGPRSFRFIDLMCTRHRELILQTRTWPPGYLPGNYTPGNNSCDDCGETGRRQPSGRATQLPGADDVEHAAYHEAGHAVACCLLGIEVDYVTLHRSPGLDADGHVEATVEAERQGSADHLLVLLAGQAAARRWLIVERQLDDAALVDVVQGSCSDIADAHDDGWTSAEIAAAMAVADTFAARHWQAVEDIADMLLARGTLTGPELTALLPGRTPTAEQTTAAARAAADARFEALSAYRTEARWTMIGSVAGVISTVLALVAVIVAIVVR